MLHKDPVSFAYPVCVFDKRKAVITYNDISFEGEMSATEEQLITFTATAPESIAGMKIEHSVSGDKTFFGGITYDGMIFSDKSLPEIFSAIEKCASEENLTKGEYGYSGSTSSGEAFTVVTDTSGNIQTITIEGIKLEFKETEE
jgi:hypothetical protein